MGELGVLVLAGTGTALATGLGAIPVFADVDRVWSPDSDAWWRSADWCW